MFLLQNGRRRKVALVFLQRCEGFERQKKPDNNYVKLYNSASFGDTVTKVGSKYSLRRPLSETPVILNFGRIFQLQNNRRREVALVLLQRCDTEQVQYKSIVYTRIIQYVAVKDLNGNKRLIIIMSSFITQQVFEIQ